MILRPQSLEKLLDLLRTLPSVGPKMSERIAFHLLKFPTEKMKDFLATIQETYEQVKPCELCGYWDDSTPCRICRDSSRDPSVLCVVETPQDLIAMSRIKNYNGLYHVLGGALSPLEGIGPQDLRTRPLFEHLETGTVKEVLLALNPDIEGETTSQYLTKQIQSLVQRLKEEGKIEPSFEIRVTRLAQGLPAGGELEYMDEVTLMKAFDGRRAVILN